MRLGACAYARAWGLPFAPKACYALGMPGRWAWALWDCTNIMRHFPLHTHVYALCNESDDSDGTKPIATFEVSVSYMDRDGFDDDIGDLYMQQVITHGIFVARQLSLIDEDLNAEQVERVVYENGYGLRTEDMLLTIKHYFNFAPDPVGEEQYTIDYADFV